MIVQIAKDEDYVYEKTGVELKIFNLQVQNTKLDEDEDFKKIVTDAQDKI